MLRRLIPGVMAVLAAAGIATALRAKPLDFNAKLDEEIFPRLADRVNQILKAKGLTNKTLTVAWNVQGVSEFNGHGFEARLATRLQKVNINHAAERGDLTLTVTVIKPYPNQPVKRIKYQLVDKEGNEVDKIPDDIPYPDGETDPAPGKPDAQGGISVAPEQESGAVIEIEGPNQDTLRLVGQPYKLQILVDGKPQSFFVARDSSINSPRVRIPAGKTFEVRPLSVDTENRTGAEVYLDGIDAFALSKYPGAHFLINKAEDKSSAADHLVHGFFINEKESVRFKIGKLDEATGLTGDNRKLFDVWNNRTLAAGDRKPGVIAVHFSRSYDSRQAKAKAEGTDLGDETKLQIIPDLTQKVETNYKMVPSFLGKYRGSIAVRYVTN